MNSGENLTLSNEDRIAAWQIILDTRLPRLKWSFWGLVGGSLYVWMSILGVPPQSVAVVADLPSIGLTLVCCIVFAFNLSQLFVGYCVFRKGWSNPPRSFVKAWTNLPLSEQPSEENEEGNGNT